MKTSFIGAAAAVALTMAASATFVNAHADAPPLPAQLGTWVTESGNLEVNIAACGDALCGTVTRVLANQSMSAPGQKMEAADQRPVLGLKLLTGLRRESDAGMPREMYNRESTGQVPEGDDALIGDIYNRENGKTYSVRLTMDGPQQLRVRPYIAVPLIGKTQLWRRVAEAEPKP